MKHSLFLSFVLAASFSSIQCTRPTSPHPGAVARHVKPTDGEEKDPPEVALGEKLFREPRFAQYFSLNSKGEYNKTLANGDITVEYLTTLSGPIANPYKGHAVSCAGCHLVDQSAATFGGGSRAYTDFARRSPIPDRGDGLISTARNSPNMVGSSVNKDFMLHSDGEFASSIDLVRGSFTGRNFGWLASEKDLAIHHIAEVVRQDNGMYPNDVDAKNSYPELFLATDFLDVARASDKEIFDAVAKLVAAYLDSLDFARDRDGNNIGSPYDVFLKKNGFPLAPEKTETAEAYSRRLAMLVTAAPAVTYVTNEDGKFKLHPQDFNFGPLEMEGFKIFAGRGQCIQCHSAPDFTDHGFHNTGISQLEFDKVHGRNSFMALPIPSLAKRSEDFKAYLPATSLHPDGSGVFRSIPNRANAVMADLGVWNIWRNPDVPTPQSTLRLSLCTSLQLTCTSDAPTDAELLDLSIGLFKTPTLRDLGHSAPYFHTGQMDQIEASVMLYIPIAAMAQSNAIRNADPRLKMISITRDEVEPLSAFLRSLNEDYE